MKSGDRNANSYQIHIQPSHPWLHVTDRKLLDHKEPTISPQPYAGYPPDIQLALSKDANESNRFFHQHPKLTANKCLPLNVENLFR